jgi:hypothetical protein
MSRAKRLTAAATAAAFSVLTFAAAPATAETVAEEHCVLDIDNGEQVCFTAFDEAVTHATQGRVDSAPASLTGQQARTALRTELAGDVLQGTFFEDDDFGGDSLTITGESLCPKDGVVNFQYNLDDSWQDKISSVQAWGNCWLWLYPGPDLGGDRDGPFKENHSSIGGYMNDRTESIGFS